MTRATAALPNLLWVNFLFRHYKPIPRKTSILPFS